MISPYRDILVLLKDELITEGELLSLHKLLHTVESPAVFCKANELVDRRRITSNPQKILRERRHYYLRPFRFLINKN